MENTEQQVEQKVVVQNMQSIRDSSLNESRNENLNKLTPQV